MTGRTEHIREDNTTIFSTADFVKSWCRAFPGCDPLAVKVEGSGPPRTMHVIKTRMGYGSYRVTGPNSHDLWTSPGWTEELSRFTVEHVLDQLRGLRTRSLQWQVRFDHEPLAFILRSLGLTHRQVQIHALKLDRNYSNLFQYYSGTRRNHVRKAARRGVIVRSTSAAQDIFAYQAIYSKHARSKGWGFEYPAQLTMDLAKMSGSASFKVAEHEGMVIGGALFLRDGNSVYYLHGVADRSYNHLYPASAVLDAGIQWACQSGSDFFNFGNSGVANVTESLAAFKLSWGARVEQNWIFDWENPVWKSATKLKAKMHRTKPGSPPAGSSTGKKATQPLQWWQRASLGELSAVCDVTSEARSMIMHAATMEGAAKALSLTRKHKIAQPIILDFGCGNGRMTRFFGQRGCRVVGVDVTVDMLRAAKRHGTPSQSLLAYFDGVSIPLKDCSVDTIWISGVLKYTLFPPGSRCLHGIVSQNPLVENHFHPTYSEIAEEMYRVLKPGGIVANCEMWIDDPPDVFRPGFEQAGFITELTKVLRRDGDYLERFYLSSCGRLVPPLWPARMGAKLRYLFDDASRAGFRDYLIVWRKPPKGIPGAQTQRN